MKTAIFSRFLAAGAFLLLFFAPAQAVQAERAFTPVTRYDMSGRVTGTIAPDPDGSESLKYLATRNTYYPNGLLWKTETGELGAWLHEEIEPKYWGSYTSFTVFTANEFTYDVYGRKAAESLRGQNGTIESFIQYSYGSNNLLLCKAVRMNPSAYGSQPTACFLGPEGSFGPDRITRYGYDGLDQLVTEERALGVPGLQQTYVTNTYNHRQLRTQTDANGNKTELRYDSYGRLWKRIYPHPTAPGSVNEGDYNEYTYDFNGNLRFERKRDGTTITNAYDSNNRIIVQDLSVNTYSVDVFYDYDLRGLQLYARYGSDTGGGEINGYDGFGLLRTHVSSTLGNTRILTYEYDANRNRTRITHPDGYFFEYGFDGLNRVNVVASSVSPTPTSGTSSLLTLRYGANGKRSHIVRPGGATTGYLHDNAQRLESFSQTFPNSGDNLENVFSYNPAHQVTNLIQGNDQYNYRELGSRTGSYVPNGLNQYAMIANQPISHDVKGNLTGDGTMSYTYDMLNRLVSTGGVGSSMTYDPLGRLVLLTAGGTTKQLLYDGDALVAEYEGETMLRRYVHGDQVDEPWLQYNGAGVATTDRRYLHADHQGSIIAHSNSAGAVTAKNAYDAYGIPAATNSDRYGFTGQMWLRELGLNYYKARVYSPRLGRFLQTDPIFYADDINLYAYVGNDPFNRNDPMGTEDVQIACDPAAGCMEDIPVNLPPPLAPDDYIDDEGNIISPPKGFTREDESMGPPDLSAPPKVVDVTQPPAEPNVSSSAPSTSEADGTGPAGFNTARQEWEEANEARQEAQRAGDLKAAAEWSQRAREAYIKMEATRGIKMDPKVYGPPTGYDR